MKNEGPLVRGAAGRAGRTHRRGEGQGLPGQKVPKIVRATQSSPYMPQAWLMPPTRAEATP